jgi:GWxTD domain-containing protein
MLMGLLFEEKGVQRILRIYLIALMVMGFGTVSAYSATFPQDEKKEGDILFDIGSSSFYERGAKTRQEVYYDVAYDQMNFLTTDTGYAATFDISVVLNDSTGMQAGGDIWRKKVTAASYEETKASRGHLASSVHFRILPGRYKMRVRIEDLSSGRSGIVERSITVREFGKSKVELSDPEFLNFSSDTLMFPDPTGEFSGDYRAAIRYEIYSTLSGDSLPMRSSITGSDGRVWNDGYIMLPNLVKQAKTVVFPVDTFAPDSYSFRVEIDNYASATWVFAVKLPFFMQADRYRERVEEMRYVASEQDLKKLREAPPSERLKVYNEFWRQKDPVPSTERNEAEEEYFDRVDYANKNFGGVVRGWKSDRGKIYIIHGKPDEVEKHPFDMDMPSYEVWYYYSSGLKFVFVDKHNLGTYDLEWWGADR